MNDAGVRCLVGTESTSKEEVVTVDSEAMNPSEELIVRCPPHQYYLSIYYHPTLHYIKYHKISYCCTNSTCWNS